jgi:hypothetical protein
MSSSVIDRWQAAGARPSLAATGPFGQEAGMPRNRTNASAWTWALAIVLAAWLLPAAPAAARGRKSGGQQTQNQIVLKLGERQHMPAKGWSSVKVTPGGLVKVIFNKRKGNLTLIPRARGTALLEFTMKLPHVPGDAKGKVKLIVK